MPKQRITKDMVVNAAFEVARTQGMESVIVKSIAEKLDCSVQPIYSYCQNMDGLRNEVAEKAKQFIHKYVADHIDTDDLFCSTGRAFVKIAKEEPHLHKIFILQERKNISSLDDLYQAETNPQIAKTISDNFNISIEKAKQLHLNMLIYTIGIGTIFSITTPGIPADEIYAQQENAYQVFLKSALEDKES